MNTSFGNLVREWRSRRRFSQLDLSLEAEVSARHVSFLESGRAKPSRGMVLKIAQALQMPRPVVNQVMLSAGLAPIYPHLANDDHALAPIRQVIDLMLENQQPWPGVAIDQHWNIIAINKSALALFNAINLAGQSNIIDALIHIGDSTKPAMENWIDVAMLTLMRLKTEIVHLGGDEVLERHAERLEQHVRLCDQDTDDCDLSRPLIPARFRVGDLTLSLILTITTFGTVQDISYERVRIEAMFPLDQVTRDWFDKRHNTGFQ